MTERPIVLPLGRLMERAMPITPCLSTATFDSETKRVIGVAFEMTCIALRLADRDDRVTEVISGRIIALAKQGERDPDDYASKP